MSDNNYEHRKKPTTKKMASEKKIGINHYALNSACIFFLLTYLYASRNAFAPDE